MIKLTRIPNPVILIVNMSEVKAIMPLVTLTINLVKHFLKTIQQCIS